MIAAFIQSKKLSAAQIAEIEAMIEDYKGYGLTKYYCDIKGSMLS